MPIESPKPIVETRTVTLTDGTVYTGPITLCPPAHAADAPRVTLRRDTRKQLAKAERAELSKPWVKGDLCSVCIKKRGHILQARHPDRWGDGRWPGRYYHAPYSSRCLYSKKHLAKIAAKKARRARRAIAD